MNRASIARNRSDLAGWMLRGGVSLFFVAFGADKFGSGAHNSWISLFDRIGFGQWLRIATGVIEVGGAILYLFPTTCRIAAVPLCLTMMGAALAHFTVLHDPGASVVPLALLVATATIAMREPETAPLGRRAS